MLVDDHPIWREALERDLAQAGYEVVAAVADGETALRLAPAVRPEVVLMDLQLPGISGVQTTAALVQQDPSRRILMFSADGEDASVIAAIKVGALGYLVKSATRDELLRAVERTEAGQATFSPGLAALVLNEYRQLCDDPAPGTPSLTSRETEILRLVTTGRTARQIAEHLTVSPRTVQNHIQNTLRKLQLHNRVELTRWALDQGITEQS
jgi:DNA-binding NarL/FixJ family response regulator